MEDSETVAEGDVDQRKSSSQNLRLWWRVGRCHGMHIMRLE